ncbi:MAG: hypothetical protein JSS11_14355 [Verrucomicrobia bacterium]|nr:hypothetical protein [Verrucomicrobiota bacterium]
MKKPVKSTTKKALTPAKKTAKPAVKKTPAAPAAKAVAPKAVVTTIVANFDVGFGRSLHIRGEGPGLSWDKGLLMECTGPDQWQIALPGESARPIVFKFLINDELWSADSDYIVPTGGSITAVPVF